ncbi:hypothetical protein TNCV_4273361 [Trichonephila clavipes]|nr:hypothetical protein TNCV_4273361 [Trichonephila clavipes]
MATNTSQDVGRSGLGHIEIWARRVNFKTRHILNQTSHDEGESCSFMRSKTVKHQRLKSNFASCVQCIFGMYFTSWTPPLQGEYTPNVLRPFRPGTLSRSDKAEIQDLGRRFSSTSCHLHQPCQSNP